MDFIIDNYLWFIVGGIVLLMIIIGFFAEKTNFGKKPLREKKENKEEKVETKEHGENEEEMLANDAISDLGNKGINDILEQSSDTNVDGDHVSESVSIDEPIADDKKEAQVLPDVNLPEEDLNVPFGDVEVKPQVEEATTIPDASEDSSDDQNYSEDDVWKF